MTYIKINTYTHPKRPNLYRAIISGFGGDNTESEYKEDGWDTYIIHGVLVVIKGEAPFDIENEDFQNAVHELTVDDNNGRNMIIKLCNDMSK